MIQVIDEAKCTGCGKCFSLCPLDTLRLDTRQREVPSCQAACPAGVDIRGYMYWLKLGEPGQAIGLLREALPLPAITGRVCFHPCETDCARNDVDEAVNINALERFVGDSWLEAEAPPFVRRHAARVAVVGSGPAGLACAYFLTMMGYATTIFEAEAQPGGMLRMGIPAYRLPRDVLDAQIKYIREMGVEFQTGTTIGKDLALDDLKNRGYRAVFLAIGNQLSKKIEIAGAGLGGVFWGLDFLRDINIGHRVPVKGKVLVIGGGDVAMDVALSALRLGARQVEVACLESREQMPAHEENIRLALEQGVKISASWGPLRINGNNRVSGVELARCTSVFNKQGKFNPCLDDEQTRFVTADMVILALGQETDLSFFPELVVRPGGTMKTDPATLATAVPGVFAGGDAVSGPSSVVEAIASGKKAAVSIDRYLKGETLKAGRLRKPEPVARVPKEGMEPMARQATPLLPADKRGDFSEVKGGFGEEAAMIEAERCLTCGSKAYIAYPEDCMTCFACELRCPYEAIYVHPFKELLPLAYE